jgi:hypothetical protein
MANKKSDSLDPKFKKTTRIINQMISIINQEKSYLKEKSLVEKRLFEQLYRELVSTIYCHAGQPFVLTISGSYEQVTKYVFVGPNPTRLIHFKKIFFGVLKPRQSKAHYGKYPENTFEEKTLLTKDSYELITSLGRWIDPVNKVYLSHNTFGNENCSLEEILMNYLPKELRPSDPLMFGDRKNIELLLGSERFKDWINSEELREQEKEEISNFTCFKEFLT